MSSIDEVPALVPGRGAGAGAPLAADVRGRMERAFGADFGEVRVHQGPEAAGMGALAYAQGADLHFAPGRFDPSSRDGAALLGHELAHVVQHAEGRAQGAHAKGLGGDAGLEHEADDMGERAARGERVRPGAPRVQARRDRGGAIHRMIDKEAPPGGSDWEAIKKYLERTLVNPRKQTFREAVEEYLACKLAPDTTVKDAWQALEDNRDKVGYAPTALTKIKAIRDAINAHKSDAPDHPNKRGIDAEDERYETVPQSQDSQTIAASLRARLLADMFTGKRPKLGSTDKWRTSFMLAVLILPNGAVNVAHSGFLCPAQSKLFAEIVKRVNPKYVPITHDDDTAYSALQDMYKKALKTDADAGKLPGGHTAGKDTEDNHKHKVIHKTGRTVVEKGNPTGVCAAPQVATKASKLAGSFPGEMQGKSQLALTEVLVRSSTDAVEVNDSSETAQSYDKTSPDVPSCLSCQHQLRAVLTRLVELRRNVANLEKVGWDEGERAKLYTAATDLRDLLKSSSKIATWVLGKETVKEEYQVKVITQVPKYKKAPIGKPMPMKDKETMETRTRDVEKDRDPKAKPEDLTTDLEKLEGLIAGYRKAVQTQATERTKHPEFVEHDDHSKVLGLEKLSKAEKDAEKEHSDNSLEAMLERRVVVGKVIGGERYNDEREKASQKAGTLEAAKAAGRSHRAQVRSDERGDELADQALRKGARDEARASASQRRYDERQRFAEEDQEESNRLLGLATSLAQAFDTSIGHQLHLMIEGDNGDPTPRTNFSSDYID